MSTETIRGLTDARSVSPYALLPCAKPKQSIAKDGPTRALVRDRVTVSNPARVDSKTDIPRGALSAKAYELLRTRDLTQDEIAAFQAVIAEAETAGDAKVFLKTLSAAERDLVKRANSYGDALSDALIDRMSQEGARNMLVSPDNRACVDLNNDGRVERGLAKTFVFPPPNAPRAVKEAWDKTTQGLSPEEQFLATSVFLVQHAMANVKMDSQGNMAGFHQPGEAGYKNIFPTDTRGWLALLDRVDAYLDWVNSASGDTNERAHAAQSRQLMARFRGHILA